MGLENARGELFALGGGHQRLFGRMVQQSWAALFLYERLLEEYRERINWICEIGTGTGALSIYWAVWSKLRGVPFLTMDSGAAAWAGWAPSSAVQDLLVRMGARVEHMDCFSEEGRRMIGSLVHGRTGLLFCDGGHKALEVATFAPVTVPGTLILAHDWPTEISDADLATVPEVAYLEPWNNQSLHQLHTRTTILERRNG